MKKLILLIVSILTIVTLTLTTASAAVSTAITNGGFEGTDAGNVYANDGSTALSVSTEQKFSGESSLKNSNRTNNYGAVAVNVTEYIKAAGAGQYYCSFRIYGTADASIRATLHTTYTDGGNYYRQVGSLTEFKAGEWTLVGYGEDGKALPLRIENWGEADITKWDANVASENLQNATLYFWVEGDTTSDFYMDELNFWGCDDTPVSFATSPDTSDNGFVAVIVLATAAAFVAAKAGKRV